MKEEAVVIFALLAVAAIPFVCLIASHWRVVVKRFAAIGFIGVAILIPKIYATGSTKPPHPPPQPPPSEEVKAEVESVTTTRLVVCPNVEGELRDALMGEACLIQLSRNNGEWETILEIDSYDLRPVVIVGQFVSGGKSTLRRVRFYWPFVEYNQEVL